MKILEINSVPYGSTCRIMLGIKDVASEQGIYVDTATGYSHHPLSEMPQNHIYIGGKVGSFVGKVLHMGLALVTGYNGCFSSFSTRELLRKITKEKYDLIHLHNIHGHYINIPMLFKYIKKHNIPVVWTLHDCWAITGQCPHFTMAKCDRWKMGCHHCSQYRQYPESLVDVTKTMWKLKKKWFSGVENMTIVTPSQWLAGLVRQSYLSEYEIKVINNGIDLSVFKPTESDFRSRNKLEDKKVILGVSLGWDARKGYGDFLKLAESLGDDYRVVLVGVSAEQIGQLPQSVIGIERTQNIQELAQIYTSADVFVNTTYEDNYPTVNLEARACGLPVVTYKTGGSPESAGEDAVVVEVGDIDGLKNAVLKIIDVGKKPYKQVVSISDKQKFTEYVDIYRVFDK